MENKNSKSVNPGQNKLPNRNVFISGGAIAIIIAVIVALSATSS